MSNLTLKKAYQYCQKISLQHYENFPIASHFLPKRIRQPIAVIYAFARTADDFADEGDIDDAQRLQLLQSYHEQLESINNNDKIEHLLFIALADVIQQFKLPLKLFHDLLDAFEQDVIQDSYKTEQQLLDYCDKSANPIGRLMLYLHHEASPSNKQYSDKICSALQLINFLQDLQQDAIESGRLYLPLSSINAFNISPQQLLQRITTGEKYNTQEMLLIKQQIELAEQLLYSGKPLIKNLSGRFQLEITLIFYSGAKIIEQLKQSTHFCDRPRLNKLAKLTILGKSLIRWIFRLN